MPVQSSTSVKSLASAFEPAPVAPKKRTPPPLPKKLHELSGFDAPGSKEERAKQKAQVMLALQGRFSVTEHSSTVKAVSPKAAAQAAPAAPVRVVVDEGALFAKAVPKLKAALDNLTQSFGSRAMAERMKAHPEVLAWFQACKGDQTKLKDRTLELAKMLEESGYKGRQHSNITKAMALMLELHAAQDISVHIDCFVARALAEAKVPMEQVESLTNAYLKKALYRGNAICDEVLEGNAISAQKMEKFQKALRIAQRLYPIAHGSTLNEVQILGKRIGSLLMACTTSQEDVAHGFFGRKTMLARYGKEFAAGVRSFEEAQRKNIVPAMRSALQGLNGMVAGYRRAVSIREGLSQGKLQDMGRAIAPDAMRRRTSSIIESDPKLAAALEQVARLTSVAADASLAKLKQACGADKLVLGRACAKELGMRFVDDSKRSVGEQFKRSLSLHEATTSLSAYEIAFCEAVCKELDQPKA